MSIRPRAAAWRLLTAPSMLHTLPPNWAASTGPAKRRSIPEPAETLWQMTAVLADPGYLPSVYAGRIDARPTIRPPCGRVCRVLTIRVNRTRPNQFPKDISTWRNGDISIQPLHTTRRIILGTRQTLHRHRHAGDDLIRHGKRRAEGLPVLENEVPGIDRWALLGKAVRGQ